MRPDTVFRRSRAAVLVALVALLSLSLPSPAAAVGFSANRVLEDADMDLDAPRGASLSKSSIAQFLGGTGGAIGRMTFEDRGVVRTVPEIVADASATYRISAQYLLTLLEKEQSLITDPAPSQHQLDYAMGYACPSSGCSPTYAGFAKQVRSAAAQTRGYLDDLSERNRTISGWGVGVPKTTVDGIVVIPANAATAAAYTYNPLVGAYGGGDPRYGAVSLLWRLFQRWFVARYPDGTLLRQSGTGGVWLLQNGLRRPFVSKAAFLASYDPELVIDVPSTVLALYPVGTSIRFPAVGLVRIETGGVYLLDGETKRPIPSMTVFRALGFNPEEVQRVSSADIATLTLGTKVSIDEQFPTGKLVQIRETGGVVWVKDGVRHSVLDRGVWTNRFGPERPTVLSRQAVEGFTAGTPVLVKDGTLIRARGLPTIYVVSNGTKRPIADAETFRHLGYKWSKIITLSAAAVNVHPTGAAITSVAL